MSVEKVKVASPGIGEEEIEVAAAVLRSGNLVQGANVAAFEEEFAEYIGTEYAIAVNSGTAALHCAIVAAGVSPGASVIVPAMSFFATVEAVVHAGCIPVFADVGPNGSMTAGTFEAAMIRTPEARAVIPVHLFGDMAEIDEITRDAEEMGVTVIEDAAQAHGAACDLQKAGNWSDAGCFSFFATKHITTIEGGMVTTDDPVIDGFIRQMRHHGMEGRSTHEIWGYNYRMNEVGAAIGRVQLRKLEENLGAMRIVSELILKAIEDLDWLEVRWPEKWINPAWFWCPLYVKAPIDPATVRQHLIDRGIETRYRYRAPLYHQPVVQRDLAPFEPEKDCPVAEEIAGRFIGLPNRPDLTQAEYTRVIEAVREFKP